MGHERTAPFEALKKPPALRVEVTGLAHKASGLSPASFRSSVLSAVCWGKPACGTDHGTYLIRLILRRGFLPSKRLSKMGQGRPEIGQGVFSYSVCESRTQSHTDVHTGRSRLTLAIDTFFSCVFRNFIFLKQLFEATAKSCYNYGNYFYLVIGGTEMGYHRYKHKSGGYYRGRSRSGRYYTRQGCYIATCVYGSYNCPEVWVLRRFRDNYLDNFFIGRIFIKLYYMASPNLVKLFGNCEWFKKGWKNILDRFINLLVCHGISSAAYIDKY